MTMLGMDVDGVTTLATQLDGQDAAVENVTRAVDAIVAQSATEWFGADAAQFTQQWNAQHKPALLQAQAAIATLVASLRRNIAEQQDASSSSGGRPPAAQGGVTADGLLDVERRDMSVGAGPSGIPGLLGLLDKAYTQPGGVAVTFVGSGDSRRAIVTVSGTETWLPGSNNVDDISTNVSDVLGISNLKQEAIATAMRNAGVTPQDDVLLVGHSQGGADVVNFAANHELASQYHITGVLTAGAPETIAYPASNVPVMQLRTPGDVVPSLGLASAVGLAGGGPIGMRVAEYVHDALVPGNVDIVNLDGPMKGIAGAHDPHNYAADVAVSTNSALAQFAASQGEYLTGEQSTTYVYSAQRTPGDFWDMLR